MMIGGMMFQSFIEAHGKILAGVFLSGCNMRCPFCHNKILHEGGRFRTSDDVIRELLKGNFLVDGVLISGGEPMLQHKEVTIFINKIRDSDDYSDMFIVLHTNGTYPRELGEIIDKIDKVCIDLKGTIQEYYNRFANTGYRPTVYAVKDSIEKLRENDEVRRVITSVLDKTELNRLGNLMRGKKPALVLVPYTPPPGEEGGYLKRPSEQEIIEMRDYLDQNFGINVRVQEWTQ